VPAIQILTRSGHAAIRHWITSSAWASSIGGISRPSAFAVLRLMTISNFLGCSTGRSAGLVPLRIEARLQLPTRSRALSSHVRGQITFDMAKLLSSTWLKPWRQPAGFRFPCRAMPCFSQPKPFPLETRTDGVLSLAAEPMLAPYQLNPAECSSVVWEHQILTDNCFISSNQVAVVVSCTLPLCFVRLPADRWVLSRLAPQLAKMRSCRRSCSLFPCVLWYWSAALLRPSRALSLCMSLSRRYARR
jgi:hypothetical protein